MISWMQKHRKYLVVTIWVSTVAFVGAGFVGWGAYKPGMGSSDTIAKVGSIDVSNKDLQAKYSDIYNYYNKMFSGRLTKEKAKELKLQDLALKQLFNETIYLNYAKDLGLSVSDKEVLKEIANIDAFKVDGHFSESRYNSILQNLGTSSYDFKNQIRKTLTLQKLFKALDLPATELEKKAIFATLYLQDKIRYKLISDEQINIQLSEDEIKEFWNKNKKRYKSQKKYSLDLVKVFTSSVTATDEEAKKFYDEKKYMFKDSDGKILPFEKAKVRVVHEVQLKKAKKEILKKYLKLKNKKIQPEESIEVTAFNTKIPMDQISSAKVGDYIRAIKTSYGYACAYLKDVIQPKELPFEEAKEMVKEDLMIAKKEQALKNLGEKASKDLKDAKTTDYITRNDVEKLDFLSKNEAIEFLNHLFTQTQKKGFYTFANKVIAYEVTDQKLFDKALFEKNKNEIKTAVDTLKKRDLENGLLDRLKKVYTIKKYYK